MSGRVRNSPRHPTGRGRSAGRHLPEGARPRLRWGRLRLPRHSPDSQQATRCRRNAGILRALREWTSAVPQHPAAPIFRSLVKSPVSELSPTPCKPPRRRPRPGAQRDERPWPDEDTERARRAPTASKCTAGDSCSRWWRASRWPPQPPPQSRWPRSPLRAGQSRATSRPARMAASFRSSR